MAFHHHIKAHHHASIWAIAPLALITSATMYSSALISHAEDQKATTEQSSGPSEHTKQFFGDKDGAKDANAKPAECDGQLGNGGQGAQEAKYKERDNLEHDMTPLKTALESLGDASGDTEEKASQRAELTAKIAEKKAAFDALTVEIGTRDSTTKSGPTTECKKAIVDQQRKRFETFQSKIDSTILPTFVKVDGLVTKVEAQIPAMKEAGVDTAIIDAMTADLTSIKADSATLKSFFNDMKSTIKTFSAESDPDAAFQKMKAGGNGSTKASVAADDLVKKFEDLTSLIDQIK
jgi:hypothetical protein